MNRRRVVIVGGGISGLAAAYYLASQASQADPAPQITLLESQPQLGGKVRTHALTVGDGTRFSVETGPDAFIVRAPALKSLIDELGLADSVVAPQIARAYIWSQGQLRALPSDTVFGVPKKIGPILRSGLLSPAGILRAGADLILPRRPAAPDASVGELLRPRFGDQLVSRLIEPLLGGVYAGRIDRLSAASTVPEIAAVASRSRSLYLGVRKMPAAPKGPMLCTIDGGLGGLIDTLRGRLAGHDIRTDVGVASLEDTATGYRLTTTTGEVICADAVILATPAYVSASLIDPLLPRAAEALRGIEYASVATITLAYPIAAVGRPLDATGFLVTPAERRLLVGCSWLSAKWGYLANPDYAIIRTQVGRSDDDRWLTMDDRELVGRVHSELAEAIGLRTAPLSSHIQRWPRALPQYNVGHADRLSTIDNGLAKLPGVFVTGAAYRGVGLAGCVAMAKQTAQATRTHLAARIAHGTLEEL